MQKLEVDVPCPDCKRPIRKRVEEMRPGMSMRCPYCRAYIRFMGDDGGKVQRWMDDLARNVTGIRGSIKLW